MKIYGQNAQDAFKAIYLAEEMIRFAKAQINVRFNSEDTDEVLQTLKDLQGKLVRYNMDDFYLTKVA